MSDQNEATTAADAMMSAVASLLVGIESLCRERMQGLDEDAAMAEARAQLVVWRALGWHHAEKIRKSQVPHGVRKRITSAVKLSMKLIPRSLR